MRRASLTLLLIVLFVGSDGIAEIYRDIRPYDTRADIQKKFPGAKFELLHPAWAKKSDLLYSIDGSGLSGTMVVKFTDNVEASIEVDKEIMSNYCSRTDAIGVDNCRYFQGLLNEDSERATVSMREAWTQVEWVRWIPDLFSPIPIERLITLYGTPDKSGVDDTNFQSYKHWNRGVDAYTSDDGKTVASIEYTFTTDEKKQEWMLKHPTARCRTATSLGELERDECPPEFIKEILDRQGPRKSGKPATSTPTKGR